MEVNNDSWKPNSRLEKEIENHYKKGMKIWVANEIIRFTQELLDSDNVNIIEHHRADVKKFYLERLKAFREKIFQTNVTPEN